MRIGSCLDYTAGSFGGVKKGTREGGREGGRREREGEGGREGHQFTSHSRL